MEIALGTFMIVSMVGAVLGKYLTIRRMYKLREGIFQAESDVRSVRSRLKGAENERAIAERNVKNLDRHVSSLDKQITLVKVELDTLKK